MTPLCGYMWGHPTLDGDTFVVYDHGCDLPATHRGPCRCTCGKADWMGWLTAPAMIALILIALCAGVTVAINL